MINSGLDWGNHKGLPLQIIIKRRGNPLWLPEMQMAVKQSLEMIKTVKMGIRPSKGIVAKIEIIY